MKILQFGRTGQVATAVQAAARERIEVLALSRADCDLGDPTAIRGAIQAAKCDLVLNTAAFAEPARRPPRSPLDTAKLRKVLGFEPEPWRPAVERAADRLLARL